MAIVLKIKWVEQSSQPEPHLRIRKIGGDSGQFLWKHTQAEAVANLERELFAYYVEQNARPLKLDIAQAADGTKYLTVFPGQPHLLLNLPGFPESAPADAANLEPSRPN